MVYLLSENKQQTKKKQCQQNRKKRNSINLLYKPFYLNQESNSHIIKSTFYGYISISQFLTHHKIILITRNVRHLAVNIVFQDVCKQNRF